MAIFTKSEEKGPDLVDQALETLTLGFYKAETYHKGTAVNIDTGNTASAIGSSAREAEINAAVTLSKQEKSWWKG